MRPTLSEDIHRRTDDGPDDQISARDTQRRTASKPTPQKLITFKARWRDAVLRDLRFTPAERCILYLYADRLTLEHTVDNWWRTKKIEIWGNQDDLAAEAGCYVKTARHALKKAQQHSYLELAKRGNQYGGSNRFSMHIPTRSRASERRQARP